MQPFQSRIQNVACRFETTFVFHARLIVRPNSSSLPPEYIQKYATEEALKEQEEGAGDSSSESSMSDFSEDEAQDMEL